MNANTQGIVTLADANYFLGLQSLYYSIQALADIPVLCFDIGLTTEQQAWIESMPQLEFAPIPETAEIELIKQQLSGTKLLGKKNKRIWPLWICPWLIAASPFQRTFWLDCDIVVLRNIQQLFNMLDSGPVFTLENHAPQHTPNKAALYDLLPIQHPEFDLLKPTVNGGVSGWDLIRDQEILAAYKYPILQACVDKNIEAAISWHDQGALIWAIQQHALEARVLADTNWNLCVRHTVAWKKKYLWNPKSVIQELRQDVPEVNLLHWNGQKVPWN